MTVDASEVTGAIDGLRQFLRESRELGAELSLQHMRESFDRQEDPVTGSPWPPLAASTRESRSGPALVDSGRLRGSLERGGSGNVFRVGRTAIAVGTSDPSAPFAQHGTRPHEILPRSGRVLAWGDGNFATRVQHPGTPQRRIVGVSGVVGRKIERAMKLGSEAAMRKGKK
jgi:phage gpG-like protein